MVYGRTHAAGFRAADASRGRAGRTSAWTRLLGQERGTVIAEFALMLPVLMLILLGCYESARAILLHQKLDRAAASVADLVAQSQTVSLDILADIYTAAEEQTQPFDLAGEGRVIVTSIYRANGALTPTIVWQANSGTGPTVTSSLGQDGEVPTLPDGFTVDEDENVIVAEVFYDYTAFLYQGLFEEGIVDHRTFARPRGALLTVPPS
jgi:Flp pilus assembly protein TadG